MPEKTPRIALFFRYLGGGGAEVVMLNLAQGLVKQGIKVDLVLGKAWGPHLKKVPAELNLIDLGTSNFFSTVFGLKRYLKQEQPEALIAAMHYGNEISILAKHLAGVTTHVVVTEHNTLSHSLRQGSSLKKRLLPLIIRFSAPWANRIVAVSKGVADDLAATTGLARSSIQAIYNPVITPSLLQKAQEPLDHPWFLPDQPPVILGVGKLEKQKDFVTLIRAFAQVRQSHSARLVILGWGPDQEKLETLAKEMGLEADISIAGYVENPYRYMARSRVFVLSSAWEGLPTVLIEALATGVAVVSTDCRSGPAEILAQGRYGELVPVGDSEAMAAAIGRVLSGEIRPVDPQWLDQFRLETTTQQYLAALGISLPESAIAT